MEKARHKQNSLEHRTSLTPKDTNILQRVYLFSGMTPEMLRTLFSSSVVHHSHAGSTLFMHGDPADRFYVLLDGWVKLYRVSENGQEIVISVISPGESFAEAAIFDSLVFPVNASAITDTRLLVVQANTFLQQLERNTKLMFNMMASMSRQMRKNVTQLHHLSTMSSSQRLANFLLELSPVKMGEAVIQLPMDKALIAARLNMQPETFSRALNKLKNCGVTTTGHTITIDDIAKLSAIISSNTDPS